MRLKTSPGQVYNSLGQVGVERFRKEILILSFRASRVSKTFSYICLALLLGSTVSLNGARILIR